MMMRRLLGQNFRPKYFSTAKSFKIIGLQQVAVGGIDKMALRRFWVDILGIHKTGEYRSEVFNK